MGSAILSDCGTYRYTLGRVWEDMLGRLWKGAYDLPPCVLFVLLNPSKADAETDDHTLRKGVGFAKRWGFGSLVFVNLFAFRATKPSAMKAAADPVGAMNDFHITNQAALANRIVLAWGTHGSHLGRDQAVLRLLRQRGYELYCLGKTKGGHPKHPLTLPYSTELVPWEKP